MRFPPYTYVPGHWPHPSRDPAGHSFGREAEAVLPLDAEAWQHNETWLEGIELFDRGYYWEAHEAWEALWVAAGRTGAVADLLNGLIKLAAAGVKIRQGLGPQAARLGALASERFDRAQLECGTQRLAGLAFADLHALAQELGAAPSGEVSTLEPLLIVFHGTVRGAQSEHDEDSALEVTLEYHRRTKHLPGRFAKALGYMDWDTQPDPFRRYEDARTLSLPFAPIGPTPRYEAAFVQGEIDRAPLDVATLGQLLQDALALSAWKVAPGARWAVRVNPSSGNLHPTEGYVIAGPVAGLHERPAVYHYAPYLHALELRCQFADEAWRVIAEQLPPDTLLVGLSSIHWREAWKYGERAFRYCQHDVGHAIACVSIAAAGLGWDARLMEGVGDRDLAALLGIDRQAGPEAEHPDCLIAVSPRRLAAAKQESFRTEHLTSVLRRRPWHGRPNVLSQDHHAWPVIEETAAATTKHQPPSPTFWSSVRAPNTSLQVGDSPLSLRRLIHRRRSAVALDGTSGITREAFHQILIKTLPGASQLPFTALPWHPSIDLLLFVHRVQDVTPGLYALVREPARVHALREAMDPNFLWSRSDACPSALGLYLLEEGDARRVAKQTSCNQDIAADGVFAVAMLAEYRAPLLAHGPSFYRRLYWETGAIGQVLYLEAEASGIRGTGIGCFFDELTHRTFGITDDRFQVLYHFTMGGPVEDSRLETRPAYEHLQR